MARSDMDTCKETQRLAPRQTLFVGVTLFSMFFGAGNLILPPLLGVQAGTSVLPAFAGFLLTGVGLPVLGIVAVALAGTVRELSDRVNPVFSRIFVAAVYLAIGPCLAIPRTSSTAFEMLAPLLPEGAPLETVRLVFSVAFFAVAYLLAMHPGKLTRFLGKITGPALILLIVAVVGATLVSFAGGGVQTAPAPVAPYNGNAAVQGFLMVIATNINTLGVSEPGSVMRSVCTAGVIAGALLIAVYGGLCMVGVELSAPLAGVTNGAAVITASATLHFGAVGTVVVAAIFLLACLNVCTGLISCCGTYFAEELPRVPYRGWAVAFAVVSCIISNFGLDAIITFSVPLLNALYPMAICLVAMGMLHRACDRVPLVWLFVILFVGVVSVCTAARDAFASTLWLPFDALPLAELGLGWLVPALVGAAVGAVASLMCGKLDRG